MSNLKISQLPEYSGSTAGSWLIANNASETGTYKIQRENFLSGYAPTSSLTALSSSIATTDLGQNNRLNSIEGVTGSYATTGSNQFNGNQSISGSINTSGSINIKGTTGFTTSLGVTGSISVNGHFNQISSTYGNYIYSTVLGGGFNIIEAREGFNHISGSYNIINGNTTLTGSLTTSGSLNRFIGNVEVTGSLLMRSGSSTVNIIQTNRTQGVNFMEGGGNWLISYGGTGIYTAGNIIQADNGGYNTITGSANFLKGPTTISGALVVSGSSHRIVGNTTLTGSLNVTGSTTLNCGAGNNVLTGSLNALESFGVGNYMVAKGGGSNFLSAAVNELSASIFNRIIGPTTITGSLTSSGSLVNLISPLIRVTGSNAGVDVIFKMATGDTSTQFIQVSGGNNSNTFTSTNNGVTRITLNNYSGSNIVSNILSADRTGFFISDTTTTGGGGTSSSPYFSIAPNVSGSNPSPQFNRSLGITGSLNVTSGATISGSIITTGSVQGNVLPLTITSNTASLNLDNGNFFTLQLVGGQATHLTPSNIKPGQTVSVFVNTLGSTTMTFPSSIKQMSGSAYTPTQATGLDVLTFVSKDSSNLYMVNAKNFI